MARSSKFRFDRESNLKVKYLINDNEIGSLSYEKGKVILINEDFETVITDVDEVEVILKPLDILMNVMTFKVKKLDRELKLNQKFFGLKHVNIAMTYDQELNNETF